MMRFDAIVSFHVRHDVICFKLGKCLDVFLSDVVIPWTALANSQSKKGQPVRVSFGKKLLVAELVL